MIFTPEVTTVRSLIVPSVDVVGLSLCTSLMVLRDPTKRKKY